jgi:hypothetical protein
MSEEWGDKARTGHLHRPAEWLNLTTTVSSKHFNSLFLRRYSPRSNVLLTWCQSWRRAYQPWVFAEISSSLDLLSTLKIKASNLQIFLRILIVI